jgi:hypothetical protein
MTDDDRFADWLANCVHGYGFGYTKEQALAAMAQNVPGDSGEITVSLVEHHGGASIGPTSWEVDEFVSGERVEIPAETLVELKSKVRETNIAAERALVEGEVVHEFTDDE